MAPRVLVAFDKFKDALTAERAGAIAAREIRRVHPDWTIARAPLTDGGEGFCRILTEAAGGELINVPASGSRVERVEAPIGLIEPARIPEAVWPMLDHGGQSPQRARSRRVAVLEMAAINGLAALPAAARDPWRTSSFGTGQLVRAAAELGAGLIVLGIGGSSTSDLGLGALAALGLEFREAEGAKIRPPFPAAWERIAQIEGEIFGSIPPIVIACDVSNPLLGPDGAAAVYGPQKGLRPEDLPRHEMQARRLAELLCNHCRMPVDKMITHPGAGAAGGISFGLMTAARAKLAPGFELVSAWLDLETKIAAADVVITGEGRFDASSLAGKGPGAIVRRARQLGKRALVFAGAVADDLARDADVVAITPREVPLERALAEAESFLAQAIVRHLG